MARVGPDRPLLPSLIDRLFDAEPDVSSEPLWRSSYTVRQLKEDVRRDLEALLNTRHTRNDLTAAGGELARSALTYGVADITSVGTEAAVDQARVKSVIEEAIRRFEPRLINVKVRVMPPESGYERTLQLSVDAVLHVEPIVERVVFDSVVHAQTGTFEVGFPQ